MADSSPVALSVNCVRCNQPVTLTYTPTLVIQQQDWTCPYDGCWMLQRLKLPGRILTALGNVDPFRQKPDRPKKTMRR